MPTVSVAFYDGNPNSNGFTTSGSFTYTGPGSQAGTATITDSGSGIGGLTLDDEADDAVADVSINGQTSINSEVDAEQGWLIRDDVTGQTFNVVEFQVEDGSASGSYTLSEVPLVPGRSYTVLAFSNEPDATSGDPVFTYADFVCYAPGTLILTDIGDVPVENLVVGDRLITLDNGAQPVRWIGSRHLIFDDCPHKHQPIEIKQGAIGRGAPDRRLMVSPQHRMLLSGPIVRDMFGVDEVLAMAKGLTGLDHVRAMTGKREVTYYTLLSDRHEIIRANGAWSETFYPGATALRMIGGRMRREIETLFPALKLDTGHGYGRVARRVLERRETEDLVRALLDGESKSKGKETGRSKRKNSAKRWDEGSVADGGDVGPLTLRLVS